jgi:hypothetical protein
MRKYSIFICLIAMALFACAQNKKDKVPGDMEVSKKRLPPPSEAAASGVQKRNFRNWKG